MDLIEVDAPSDDALATFGDLRIFFGHQSVGRNVLSGVDQSYAGKEYTVSIIETTGAVVVEGGFLAHSGVGRNGAPLGKITEFEQIVDGPMGDQIDVAILKFCYVDVTSATDVGSLFDAYSTTLAELESRHPDVVFIYTTVPLTTDPGWRARLRGLLCDAPSGPGDNLARQRYNELVRAEYADTGRLFDVAAVEATLSRSPTARDKDGETYFVLNLALASDSGHLNELGASAAAAALIATVADSAREG